MQFLTLIDRNKKGISPAELSYSQLSFPDSLFPDDYFNTAVKESRETAAVCLAIMYTNHLDMQSTAVACCYGGETIRIIYLKESVAIIIAMRVL